MPDTSTILSLPYILPAQAQKHVPHNEAIRVLDLIVQLAVTDRTRSGPPSGALEGQRHIVASAASADWLGQSGKIAVFENGAWQFLAPQVGWQAFVAAEDVIAVYDGTQWAAMTDGPLQVPQLGVSALSSATNRLSVSSPATLLDHAGAGHQLKINKATTGDTASIMFQNGYSARAEVGLLAGNDLTLKVSADGAAFLDAVTVAAATGMVSAPQGMISTGFSLRDATDPTKRANFVLSGIATATTRTYTLPNVSSELAALG